MRPTRTIEHPGPRRVNEYSPPQDIKIEADNSDTTQSRLANSASGIEIEVKPYSSVIPDYSCLKIAKGWHYVGDSIVSTRPTDPRLSARHHKEILLDANSIDLDASPCYSPHSPTTSLSSFSTSDLNTEDEVKSRNRATNNAENLSQHTSQLLRRRLHRLRRKNQKRVECWRCHHLRNCLLELLSK